MSNDMRVSSNSLTKEIFTSVVLKKLPNMTDCIRICRKKENDVAAKCLLTRSAVGQSLMVLLAVGKSKLVYSTILVLLSTAR